MFSSIQFSAKVSSVSSLQYGGLCTDKRAVIVDDHLQLSCTSDSCYVLAGSRRVVGQVSGSASA